MGLDIWLTEKVETEVVSKNITHNVNKMWIEAGIYEALYESEGKTAKDIIPILIKGLENMVQNPSKYKKLNPTNGWGSYDGAVRWLTDLIIEFKDYPDGIIGISK